MSTIAVSELNNTGFQLFEDSESFLNELSDMDSTSINGGTGAPGGGGGGGGGGDISNPTALTKLAEAFVYVYGVGHIAYLAKSFSAGGFGGNQQQPQQ